MDISYISDYTKTEILYATINESKECGCDIYKILYNLVPEDYSDQFIIFINNIKEKIKIEFNKIDDIKKKINKLDLCFINNCEKRCCNFFNIRESGINREMDLEQLKYNKLDAFNSIVGDTIRNTIDYFKEEPC